MEGDRGGLEQGVSATHTIGTQTEGDGGVICLALDLVLENSVVDGRVVGGLVRSGGGPTWCSQGRSEGAQVATAFLVPLFHRRCPLALSVQRTG